jgi:hypothetical protein
MRQEKEGQVFWMGAKKFTAGPVRLAVLSLAGLSVLLAGCGNTTNTHQRALPSPTPTGEMAKSAVAILADARGELLSSTSVRVRGTVSQSVVTAGPSSSPKAHASAPTSVQQRLDLRVGRDSKGQPLATGTITTIASAGGQTLTVPIAVIRVGPQLYIFADKSYYARIGAKVPLAAGHWLSLPASQDQAFAALTDITQFATGLSATAAKTGGVLQLGTVPAVVVQTGGALVYVAASGAPLLLRLQRPATANALAGTLDFSEYGATLSARAPAGAIALQSLLK